MTKNIDRISLKKSKRTTEGLPNLPLPEQLVEGELAINYAKDVETISLKNESGTVVTFSSDNYYTEKKLGSGFTGENSAKTVTDYITELEGENLWVSGSGIGSVVLKGGNGTASGNYAVAEGLGTRANGMNSHAEGSSTQANGAQSHAEGNNTITSGSSSHAEGTSAKALGTASHAEGKNTVASGSSSHAEGTNTKASGSYSHAEGYYTKASGSSSHAEGTNTTASGRASHVEGFYTTASGESSHAEGYYTTANGSYSHAEGEYTNANNQAEHASGQYNISSSASATFGDSGNTLFSVGNGTANNARHNAFEIRQNGDIYIVNKDGDDVRLQDEIGNIDVDQVLDDTTSASTNPVSSKAVYKAVTDNELVWTNAYVVISGAISSHTEDTSIHVTSADKTNWNAKLDANAVSGYADSVKYNSTSKYVEFYHGGTGGTKVFEYDASPFLIDGMVQNVEIKDVTISGESVTCLVISFNTDAGKQDISIPLTDIFDPSKYYNKTEIDNLVGSGFTSSSITEVIIENEQIVSSSLNDLDERKLDASGITSAIAEATSALTFASNAVTAMTSYAIAASGTSIATSDTLNQAIGKLEKMISDLTTRVSTIEGIINNS